MLSTILVGESKATRIWVNMPIIVEAQLNRQYFFRVESSNTSLSFAASSKLTRPIKVELKVRFDVLFHSQVSLD